MPTNVQEIVHRTLPTVSVIIPTYNAGPGFRAMLQALWNQSLRPHEIIVIDSTSRDGTATVAETEGARVLTVDQRDFDHGGTRNLAARAATGEILVFMTQDAEPADGGLLEALVRPLADERVACSYGRQLPRADANVLEQLSRSFNYPAEPSRKGKADIDQLGIKAFFCSNVCSAMRRELFKDMGGFAEPVIFNEDLFFAAQCVLAGYEIAYAADARVVHSHNYSLKQQFKRFFDNGVSMRRNEWIYQYSSVNKAGSRLVGTQLKELHRGRKWHWVPVLIAESGAKYLGYQLGKRYNRLPASWCERFSMHRKIWDKLQTMDTGVTERG
ncbi:glycosyltransferase family 2 protein [Paenibacillus sambharensis]|uniref:Glycosyltransferase family 2 protein n=1 Tax=Paenibacillus sambharensis TaxID=1803190 RepID=A0A2W1LN24_9BACL|nr:glycosyltransferase family 2 protein [Paenibacillus sambharensis]PZD96392.1 glycosyltransferase family 2 protein [Paenibacillus sambharensis]